MIQDEKLISVVPSARQLRVQKMGFYAFVHFTVNTMTGREWGDGTEDPAIFNPTLLDADQWAAAIADAGMKGMILTCKHHDGFCLWPSKQTDHSVASSPFRGGSGDVVREAAEACRRHGLAFGVYLSPWDRHDKRYGTGKPYDDYFVAQLTELLTGYGDIFSVWFDGACGEGANGKKQHYDWDRYYDTVRRLQPGACIHVCGPDIRWCGNEAGHTREAEWSVVPLRTRDTEKVASLSQQSDDAAFRVRKISARDMDLGSRAILQGETDLIWYPAEVNTSIRPGWFWHAEEDDQVKPLDHLMGIYEKAVGGNATFLLNIPPTSDGLFHANDVQRLREIGERLRSDYACNLLPGCDILTIDAAGTALSADALRIDDDTVPPQADTACLPYVITAQWSAPVTFRRVVLKENTQYSQRVESYAIQALVGGIWQTVHSGRVIGSCRIAVMDTPVQADALRVVIDDVRVKPMLCFIGVYA